MADNTAVEVAELRARVAELEKEVERLDSVRRFHKYLCSKRFQWSRHYNAEFSLVVKGLGQILGDR